MILQTLSFDITPIKDQTNQILLDWSFAWKSWIIEWWHFYTDKWVNHQWLEITSMISKLLTDEFDLTLQQWLLIDDFHPKEKYSKKEKDQLEWSITSTYWSINRIDFEWWDLIVTRAESILKELTNRWLTKETDWKVVMKTDGDTHLINKVTWELSCALLDAAYHTIKIESSTLLINVMENNEQNHSQQSNMIEILQSYIWSDIWFIILRIAYEKYDNTPPVTNKKYTWYQWKYRAYWEKFPEIPYYKVNTKLKTFNI